MSLPALPACVDGVLALITSDPATRSLAMSECWSSDARLVTDGVLQCAGVDAIERHYLEFDEQASDPTVELRWAVTARSGDVAAAEFEMSTGSEPGAEQTTVLVHATFTVSEGRVTELRQVSHPLPAS